MPPKKGRPSSGLAGVGPVKKGPKAPYAPPEKGTTALPAARIQRLVKVDKDVNKCSKDAVFVLSVATEVFVRRLTDAAYTQARLEKRKQVIYKDIANACVDSKNAGQPSDFFFLSEVIPQPVTLNVAAERRTKRLNDLGMPYVGSATIAMAQKGHMSLSADITNQALKDMPDFVRNTDNSDTQALEALAQYDISNIGPPDSQTMVDAIAELRPAPSAALPDPAPPTGLPMIVLPNQGATVVPSVLAPVESLYSPTRPLDF